MVASAIYYRFNQEIAYDVFWGDNDMGRSLRAMDFLVMNLWNHYKSAGFEFIDLSISTESGIPNEDLLRFKETHECESSIQYTFKWDSHDLFDLKSKNRYLIHPNSEVQSKNIGEGTSIWQYSVVLKDAVIGNNCNINFNVFIENDVIIGNNVTVKSGVQLWDGMRIEDSVFIGPNVTFTNVIKPRSKQYPLKFIETILKEGSSIGANSTIIGGITVGKFAMIGAGSVVTKNIPDYTLWYGNPAIFKANICSCTNQLNDQLVCPKCKKIYKVINGQIKEQ
jgi:acetyltransferase-like isoleucine patch superfamily enzyme